ncbi:MAG: class I SAM-dependent methyltransferase [Pseudomonadota bacterium]
MKNDYVAVTEIAGDEVTQEQVDRLCNRYYWAGQYCRNKDVVEVASGTGQGLGYLASVSGSFEAGDYSEKILSITRRHYGDRIALRQFDAQELPFDPQSKDVIILFEAIYYIPDAKRFIMECRRVLRPGGVVLIATANKDLYDFNPSPHSYHYYNAKELNGLFDRAGFDTEFFGDTPVQQVSLRQRILRPVKKLAVNLGVMPKTAMGKKWLKRVVFGRLISMPAEIGLPIGSDGGSDNTVYRGNYVKPVKISSSELNKTHKVIYCMASLRSSNNPTGNQ